MERLCERYERKKVYIFSVISVFILFIILGLCAYSYSRTFRWEGTTFRLVEQSGEYAIFKDNHGNVLNVKLKSGQLNTFFLAMDIDYLDKRLSYDSTDLYEGSITTLSDGTIYKEELFSISFESKDFLSKPNPTKPTEVVLINHIVNILNNLPYTGYLIIYACLCFILILVGFMNILYPEISWKIKHCLDVEGGEPSEFYIVTCKLGGYILVGFALLSPLFYLFIIKS